MNIKYKKLLIVEVRPGANNKKILIQNKAKLLHMTKEKQKKLQPMPLDQFYARIDRSEQALENGEVISQDQLRKEIEAFKPIVHLNRGHKGAEAGLF